MLAIFIGGAIAGYAFLWANVTGRFVLTARWVTVVRGIALLATGAVLVFDVSVLARLAEFSFEPSPLFWLIALGHPGAGAVYAMTLFVTDAKAATIRRFAYGTWLVLASFPSWTYFPLAVLVGLAGVGLARSSTEGHNDRPRLVRGSPMSPTDPPPVPGQRDAKATAWEALHNAADPPPPPRHARTRRARGR